MTDHDPTRRYCLQAIGAGALSMTMPAVLGAQQSAELITKRATKLRQSLPAIGLGTFVTFDVLPGESREHLREVMRHFFEAGGRVLDTSPLYGMGELSVGDFATDLGITEQLFITNKVWSTGEFLGDDTHARRSVNQSMQRLWRKRIEVMQCHSLVNVDTVVPLLQLLKAEQQIDYVGVTHHELPYFDALADWVEKGNLDVVQVRYSILTRRAEQRILPLAQERGVAVLANMPLEKARLHKLVTDQRLPGFAERAGLTSWSEYFLKWVISHPAITCAIPSTSNPSHARENMRALAGELLDPDMRERMYRHMQTIPGFDTLDTMAWYPDKQYRGAIYRAQQALQRRS